MKTETQQRNDCQTFYWFAGLVWRLLSIDPDGKLELVRLRDHSLGVSIEPKHARLITCPATIEGAQYALEV